MTPFRVTGQSVLLEDNRWRINTLATLPIRYQGCHDGANWKDGGLDSNIGTPCGELSVIPPSSIYWFISNPRKEVFKKLEVVSVY